MKSKIILLTIAHLAFQNIECAQALDINATDAFGNTLLHDAVEQDDIPLVQNLLAQGANPNIRNEDNDTPLHRAATTSNELAHIGFITPYNPAIIHSLLHAGANPTLNNRHNQTAAAIAQNANIKQSIQIAIETRLLHKKLPEDVTRHVLSYSYE